MEHFSTPARLGHLSFEIMNAHASLDAIIDSYPMTEQLRTRLAEVSARLHAADAADRAAINARISALLA